MSHDIIVCIPCKLLIHGERNLGIHINNHHQLDKLEAEKQNIVVRIGVCNTSYYRKCPDPHNRSATRYELEEAARVEVAAAVKRAEAEKH